MAGKEGEPGKFLGKIEGKKIGAGALVLFGILSGNAVIFLATAGAGYLVWKGKKKES